MDRVLWQTRGRSAALLLVPRVRTCWLQMQTQPRGWADDMAVVYGERWVEQGRSGWRGGGFQAACDRIAARVKFSIKCKKK